MSKFAQTFKPYKEEYVFDEKVNNIVVCGKIDIQKEVNSFMDLTLESLLDKYLVGGFDLPKEDFSYVDTNDLNFIPEGDFFDMENERQDILDELEQLGINEKNVNTKRDEILKKFITKAEVKGDEKDVK